MTLIIFLTMSKHTRPSDKLQGLLLSVDLHNLLKTALQNGYDRPVMQWEKNNAFQPFRYIPHGTQSRTAFSVACVNEA